MCSSDLSSLRKAPISAFTARLLRVRSLAARFNEGPKEDVSTMRQLGLLSRSMAACAYSERPIFAFNVAFDALCAIKADCKGRLVPFLQNFASYMSVSSSARRVLARGAVPSEGTV